MNMLKFSNPLPPCVKCGHKDIVLNYCSKKNQLHDCNIIMVYNDEDHLHRNCERCRYNDVMETKDYVSKTPNNNIIKHPNWIKED